MRTAKATRDLMRSHSYTSAKMQVEALIVEAASANLDAIDLPKDFAPEWMFDPEPTGVYQKLLAVLHTAGFKTQMLRDGRGFPRALRISWSLK